MRTRFLHLYLLALFLALSLPLRSAGPEVTAYKVATCGCCSLWAENLKKNGLQVTMTPVPDMDVYKRKFGVPKHLESCHTAIVEGYVIEGHVPAADIKRLLKEKPPAKGLAAPGMPLGSPGMESQRGDVRDAFDVLLFTEDGKTTVFQHYTGN